MDTTTALENAQAPGTFDVLSFVEQTAYPTETVVVFRDVDAAAEYRKIVTERTEREEQIVKDDGDLASDEKLAALTEKLELVGERIKNSSIVFELRGMPPGVVNDILNPEGLDKENDTDADYQLREHTLVAKSVIAVRNHKGESDGRLWTQDDVSKLRRFLNEGEFLKLLKGVALVNFNAAVFDEATDAGFSGRSADVAE